jgi:hypothetical protein
MDTTNLSTVYSAEGPFATVLVDVSRDSENAEHEHELRVRSACDSLSEQGADEAIVEAVRERLAELVHRPAPVGRLVVAAAQGVLLDEVSGIRIDQPIAAYGSLPDLSAWVAHKDGTRSFVLAIVDHVGGDVAVYESDIPDPVEEESVQGETHHAHKVPVGGWSALRYQHVTENVWAQNAAEVAEAVAGHLDQGHDLVLLAGDPQSRPLVLEKLEKLADPGVAVVELDSGTRAADGGDEALQQAIREALMDQAVQRRLALSHELKDRLGRDYAVATGVRDVADAFVRGQVETLLLDPPAAAELSLDTAQHPGLAVGAEGELRADQALLAAAALTAADVAVAPRAILGGSPVAALLRWDQDAQASDVRADAAS